jgi:hypothetical protein
MDIHTLYALRSPLGLPAHPAIFLALLVLTWALHMLAVHVMLGSAALCLFGSFSAGPRWRRLASAMLDTAKVAISIAIVLGVAPLLFVQTLYDPFWYVSNVLSARWALGFIFILIVAYWSLYLRYFQKGGAEAETGRWTVALTLALLLLAGFIMHVLASQMLRPEQWLAWYAPGGHIDPSGAGIHAFSLPRFLYFVALAVPVTGAWLRGMQRYLGQRGGEDLEYARWLGALGQRLMSGGGLLALLCYALWMSSLPDSAKGFSASVWAVLGMAATGLLAVAPLLFKAEGGDYRPAAAALAALLGIAWMRESLRLTILSGTHGYDLFTYAVHVDGYGASLFFLSFALLGGPAVAFSVALSWQSGQTAGIYTASPWVARLGNWAVLALGLWIVQYFLFGLTTLLR